MLSQSCLAAAFTAMLTMFASQGASAAYFNIFNIEGESDQIAQYVTYATLDDMLNDANRLAVFNPDDSSSFAGRNIVGSGSDGETFWSLFNIEGESDQIAQYVTYATLDDMLNDANRIAVFNPDDSSSFAGRNIVGSGSDGETYWSLFNIEGESDQLAQFVTYATLVDMLNDANRIAVFNPDDSSAFAGRNIVGTGAFVPPSEIPIPGAALLFAAGLFSMQRFHRARRK